MVYRLTPELETEIYYLSTEEGGRKLGVASGYRGQFCYDGIDHDAGQEFIDKNICNPGETVKVYLQTLSPNYHVGKFFIGKKFEIREGRIIVGKGKITKIFRSDFYKKNIMKNLEEVLLEKTINLLQEVTDEPDDKYNSSIEKGRKIIIEYKNNGGTQQKAFETLYCLLNLYEDRNMEIKYHFIANILDIIIGYIKNKQTLIWE